MKSIQLKSIIPASSNHSPFFKKEGSNHFFGDTNKPFFNTSAIQAKLTVNQPGDPYEKEADAMADKVVQRMNDQSLSNSENESPYIFTRPAKLIHRKCDTCDKEEKLQKKGNEDEKEIQKETLQLKPIFESNAAPREDDKNIQRKCDECEKEEQVQKKPDPKDYPVASPPTENKLASAANNGFQISDGTRKPMEHSFKTDFSNVRVHTDSSAIQMSKDLNAQAFTHGHDIYFNENKYRPGAESGRHLLAHELTHVVQQGSDNQSVQRLPDDKHDLTAAQFSGDTVLERTFDQEAIIGKFSNSKGGHVGKIQGALIQLGIALPVSGPDEKFGKETENAVKEFQQKASMSLTEQDGIVGRKTIGLLDRSLRNDVISTDTDEAKDDFTVKDEKKDEACKGKATDQACPDPNTAVKTAAGQAIDMIDKVLNEQLPPVKNKKADYPGIFDRIFRNNDSRDISFKVDEVKKVYEEIKKFIQRLATEKDIVRCATECDGGCRSGSPAYHTPGKAGKHIISFCPDFEKSKERILIVIHECHHAAIPGSSDKAYAETRLFDKLDHAKALLNAASFHVYAAWVDTPGSQPIGPEVKDTNLINDKTEKANVDMSLAFLQQWFRLVPFDVSQTVQGAEEAKEKGKYTRNNPKVFMEVVFSKWFGLTSPPAVPTATDIKKLKAIEERIKNMDEAFKVPFVILETNNESFWSQGPGSSIALNKNVLKLDSTHMIIALLQELVHATPAISAETEPLYVGTVNDMRNLRQLDP